MGSAGPLSCPTSDLAPEKVERNGRQTSVCVDSLDGWTLDRYPDRVQVLIPGERGGVFRGLVEDGQVGMVTIALMQAIEKSFKVDGARITQSEVKRRFEICTKIFTSLRGDLNWGITRAVDKLPAYLRAELDGKQWMPDSRTMWVPEDGEI